MKGLRRYITGVLLLAALFVPQFCFADALPAGPVERMGGWLWVVIALVVVVIAAIIIIKRRKKK